MGKTALNDLLRDRNFRYFFRINKRIIHVGFWVVINELRSYYNKFSTFPKLISDQNPTFTYKLFVIYNYFKIIAVQPKISFNRLMNYIPTRLQQYFIYKLDPREKRIFTFDKLLFYKILEKEKLPYPKVFFFTKDDQKFKLNNELFDNETDLLPSKFFVKPIRNNGGEYAGIYSKGELNTVKDDFLAQELAHNHPLLIELAGSYAFNTVRIISYLDKLGNIHFLSAILRLSTGKQVDNWGKGSINVSIDIESGKLGKNGITKYYTTYENHPISKIKFENFKIPFWNELIEVVKKGCGRFNFLRLIAWDIGIGRDGPIIVEANSGCDFFHAQLFQPYGESILMKELINE